MGVQEQKCLGVIFNSVPALPKTENKETIEVHQTTVTDRNNSMVTIEDGPNIQANGNIAEVVSQLSNSVCRTDDISH